MWAEWGGDLSLQPADSAASSCASHASCPLWSFYLAFWTIYVLSGELCGQGDREPDAILRREPAGTIQERDAPGEKGVRKMLVLSRHRDESIIIGDDIVITIVDIRGDKVRLGIEAPRHITIWRDEVYLKHHAELPRHGSMHVKP